MTTLSATCIINTQNRTRVTREAYQIICSRYANLKSIRVVRPETVRPTTSDMLLLADKSMLRSLAVPCLPPTHDETGLSVTSDAKLSRFMNQLEVLECRDAVDTSL
jgi:hypothetical protein